MKFSDVLPALEAGRKVRREGWVAPLGERHPGDVRMEASPDDLVATDWELVPDPAYCNRCGGLRDDAPSVVEYTGNIPPTFCQCPSPDFVEAGERESKLRKEMERLGRATNLRGLPVTSRNVEMTKVTPA